VLAFECTCTLKKYSITLFGISPYYFLLYFCISAIEGFKVKLLHPSDSKEASSFKLVVSKVHLIFTAETHNFPTGVAPFR
jgi:hypothetical protein